MGQLYVSSYCIPVKPYRQHLISPAMKLGNIHKLLSVTDVYLRLDVQLSMKAE